MSHALEIADRLHTIGAGSPANDDRKTIYAAAAEIRRLTNALAKVEARRPYVRYGAEHIDYMEFKWAQGCSWKEIARDMTTLFDKLFDDKNLRDIARKHRSRFPERNRGRPRTKT